MSEAKVQRPLSPHLSIYRLTPTMVMSIVHRITGSALYFGTILIAWWLLAVSGSGRAIRIRQQLFSDRGSGS